MHVPQRERAMSAESGSGSEDQLAFSESSSEEAFYYEEGEIEDGNDDDEYLLKPDEMYRKKKSLMSRDTLASSSENVEEVYMDDLDYALWVEEVSDMPEVIDQCVEEMRDVWQRRAYHMGLRSLSFSELEYIEPRDLYDNRSLSTGCIPNPLDYSHVGGQRIMSSDSITYVFFNQARSMDAMGLEEPSPERMMSATSEPTCAEKEMRHKFGIDEGLLPFREQSQSLEQLSQQQATASEAMQAAKQRSRSLDESRLLDDSDESPEPTLETIFGGIDTKPPTGRGKGHGEHKEDPVRLRNKKRVIDPTKRVSWGDVEERLQRGYNEIQESGLIPVVSTSEAAIQETPVRLDSAMSSDETSLVSVTDVSTVCSVQPVSSASVSSGTTDAHTSPIPFDDILPSSPKKSPRSAARDRARPSSMIQSALDHIRNAIHINADSEAPGVSRVATSHQAAAPPSGAHVPPLAQSSPWQSQQLHRPSSEHILSAGQQPNMHMQYPFQAGAAGGSPWGAIPPGMTFPHSVPDLQRMPGFQPYNVFLQGMGNVASAMYSSTGSLGRTIETQTYPQLRGIETQTYQNMRVVSTQTSPRSRSESPPRERVHAPGPAVVTVDTGCNPSPPRGASPVQAEHVAPVALTRYNIPPLDLDELPDAAPVDDIELSDDDYSPPAPVIPLQRPQEEIIIEKITHRQQSSHRETATTPIVEVSDFSAANPDLDQLKEEHEKLHSFLKKSHDERSKAKQQRQLFQTQLLSDIAAIRERELGEASTSTSRESAKHRAKQSKEPVRAKQSKEPVRAEEAHSVATTENSVSTHTQRSTNTGHSSDASLTLAHGSDVHAYNSNFANNDSERWSETSSLPGAEMSVVVTQFMKDDGETENYFEEERVVPKKSPRRKNKPSPRGLQQDSDFRSSEPFSFDIRERHPGSVESVTEGAAAMGGHNEGEDARRRSQDDQETIVLNYRYGADVRTRLDSETDEDRRNAYRPGHAFQTVTQQTQASTQQVEGAEGGAADDPNKIDAIIKKYQTIKRLVEGNEGEDVERSSSGYTDETPKHQRKRTAHAAVGDDSVTLDGTETYRSGDSEMKDEAVETDVRGEYLSDELERLRRERQRILDMLAKDMVPSKVQVEMAEAHLNYVIGQTDTLLDAMDDTNWDREWANMSRFAEYPEQELTEISKELLARYKVTLEASKHHIEAKIEELEKEKQKHDRERERRRKIMKMKRKAAIEAFKLEREREQSEFENRKHMPSSSRSKSNSPRRRPPSRAESVASSQYSGRFRSRTPLEFAQRLSELRRDVVTTTNQMERSRSPSVQSVTSTHSGRSQATSLYEPRGSSYSPYRSAYLVQNTAESFRDFTQRHMSPSSRSGISPSRGGYAGSTLSRIDDADSYEGSIHSLDEDTHRLLGDVQQVRGRTAREIERAKKDLRERKPRGSGSSTGSGRGRPLGSAASTASGRYYRLSSSLSDYNRYLSPNATARLTSYDYRYIDSLDAAEIDRRARERIQDIERANRTLPEKYRPSSRISLMRSASFRVPNQGAGSTTDKQIDHEIEELKRKYGQMAREQSERSTTAGGQGHRVATSDTSRIMDRYIPSSDRPSNASVSRSHSITQPSRPSISVDTVRRTASLRENSTSGSLYRNMFRTNTTSTPPGAGPSGGLS